MKQRKEVRHNVIHMVCNEHLVAIELNLILLDSHSLLNLREVENTCQMERIVHIQMDVEQRIFVCRIKCPIEILVILIFQLRWLAGPQRLYSVDYLIFISIYIFTVFPFLLLAENNRERHEFAVLVQKLLDLALGSIL